MVRLAVKRPATRRLIKSKPSAKSTKRGPKSSGQNAFERAKQKAGGITGYTGAKGFDQSRREKKKADKNREKRNQPWRLWMPEGSERDIIIVSDQPYFMYEHQLRNDHGKQPIFERCIKESGHCPLCSSTGREGYYVMGLQVIDLASYKKKKTGEKVNASQKLLMIKQGMHPKYERQYKANGNSFRGLKLHLIRDGERSFSSGNDLEKIAKLSDEKLARYGDLAKLHDFDKMFPELSEKEMAKQYNAAGAMGSKDFDDDDKDDNDVEDSESWED